MHNNVNKYHKYLSPSRFWHSPERSIPATTTTTTMTATTMTTTTTTTRATKGMELRARQETPRVSSRLFLRSLLEVRHYSNDTLVSLPSRSLPPFLLITPFSWAAPDGASPFLSGRAGLLYQRKGYQVMAIGMFANDSAILRVEKGEVKGREREDSSRDAMRWRDNAEGIMQSAH